MAHVMAQLLSKARYPGKSPAMLPAACDQCRGMQDSAATMRLLHALLALLAAICATMARADPADITAASRSVVRVVLIAGSGDNVALQGHGSGVAVGPNLILTNAHVVESAEEFEAVRIGVVPPQGKSGWFATIVAIEHRNDLALIRLTEPGAIPAATLFTGPVEDGADVYAVGYPGNVDLAQGLGIGDIVSPTAPVKTHGNVSGGRSSKAFDTILHTAPIGAGNSGGPLLDGCGRVAGINSFGTESVTGADSTFYFAVSMQEVMRFLTQAGVKVQTSGMPCRSIADLDRDEAERLAGAKAQSDEQARADADKRAETLRKAERQAQLDVIAARENRMALAGLGVLLALAAGGAAFILGQKPDKQREVKGAAIAAVLLLTGALIAWFSRPSLAEIDERARKLVQASESPSPAASTSASTSAALASLAGDYICVLDTQRSRVTVSPVTDVPLGWSEDGCVNGRTPYGLSTNGWSRTLVPKQEQTVTVASFDPATATYKSERYLLDLDAMEQLRTVRAKFSAPSCGAGEEEARKLGDAENALKALLPAQPNERLVYKCRADRNGADQGLTGK
jgi:serine protease Do